LYVFDSFEDVPRQAWDVVVCRHVLEHVEEPLHVLCQLRELLADDRSQLWLILPRERHYKCSLEPDLNQHLFCWNFRTANNLLYRASLQPIINREAFILGYRVLLPLRRLMGKAVYYHALRLAGWVKRNGELIVRARLLM
jgi:hypothetical protein